MGPESGGLFTLFAILFFFTGVQIFALGVIGEYIGRIFSGSQETAQVHRQEGTSVRAVVFCVSRDRIRMPRGIAQEQDRGRGPFHPQRRPRRGDMVPYAPNPGSRSGAYRCSRRRPADPAWIEHIRAFAPDYLFSFYYRNMLPQSILDIPKIAAMNLHGSLLPRFRGRCPVNWVLIEGEKKTGVTLHLMEAKPDAGDIVAQREVDIAFEDTAHTLALKLVEASRALMRDVMPLLGIGHVRKKTPNRSFLLLRGKKTGGRPHRLVARAPTRSTI